MLCCQCVIYAAVQWCTGACCCGTVGSCSVTGRRPMQCCTRPSLRDGKSSKNPFLSLLLGGLETDFEGSWTARPRPCASPRRAQSKSFWQIRKKGACGQVVYRGAREVARHVKVGRDSPSEPLSSRLALGLAWHRSEREQEPLINSSAQVHTLRPRSRGRARDATSSRLRARRPRRDVAPSDSR